jgi:MFS family permease
MIAASLAVWSAATTLSALAQNYVHLFLARLVVGGGESGYGPATWSLVTDLFPREKVAFGTGVLAIGASVGTGLALFLGGAVLSFVEHLPAVALPFGMIRPWQWALIIVGLPGVFWAIVVMMTHEPVRRGLSGAAKKTVPISEVFGYMGKEWQSYTATIGGITMKYLVVLGINQWMPTLFHREFGWPLSKIGLVQGSIAIVAAPIGMYVGAKLSERWLKQGKQNANLQIALICLLVVVPISVILPLMPTAELALALLPISYFFFSIGVGPSIAAFQLMTPSTIRAQIGAVSQFGSNVIAFTLAPLIVALFTDFVFKDPMLLKYSMACSAAILGPVAILIVWQGLGAYTRTLDRFAKEQGL